MRVPCRSRGRTVRCQDLVELPIPPVALRCPNIWLGRCRQWRCVAEDHGCVIRLIVHRPVVARGTVCGHACPKAHNLRRQGHLNRVGGVDVVVTLVLGELPLFSTTRVHPRQQTCSHTQAQFDADPGHARNKCTSTAALRMKLRVHTGVSLSTWNTNGCSSA